MNTFKGAEQIVLSVETNGTFRGARLITNQPIQKGEIITRFSNAPIIKNQTYQSIQVGRNQHVLVDSTLAKLNHSCAPNVLVDTRRRAVVALQDISLGKEVTYFYPSTEWIMAEPFQCGCENSQCAGWIAGAKFLPVYILENYFINIHIRALIQDALSGWRGLSQGLTKREQTKFSTYATIYP